VHISEEVEDASLVVPRCMFWSFVYNVVLGIVMLIVMLSVTDSLHAQSTELLLTTHCSLDSA